MASLVISPEKDRPIAFWAMVSKVDDFEREICSPKWGTSGFQCHFLIIRKDLRQDSQPSLGHTSNNWHSWSRFQNWMMDDGHFWPGSQLFICKNRSKPAATGSKWRCFRWTKQVNAGMLGSIFVMLAGRLALGESPDGANWILGDPGLPSFPREN